MTHALRLAGGADYDALASWVRSAEECDRWAGPHLRYPFTGAPLPVLMAALPAVVAGEVRTGHVLVQAVAADTPLAYGELIREAADSARLGRIIVAHEHRGRGLGAALCRLLIGQAEAIEQIARVRLFVYCDNEAAIRLYAGLGMRATPGRPPGRVVEMQMTLERPPRR